MLEITIPNEGHTVACLLRNRLFDNDAEFAACVVPHPQSKDLIIKVDGVNPVSIIKNSINDARNTISNIQAGVNSYIIHKNLQENQDMCDN